MFAKFKISINELRKVTGTYDVTRQMKENENLYEDKLTQLLIPDEESKVINGDAIKGLSFPTEFGKYDIFISHSFSDVEDAIRLSEYIKRNYNLRCFIDSQVWGSAYNLLEKLDEVCAKKGDKLYDYTARNKTTAHVYSMLSMALMEMIDNTECCLVVESSNSELNFNNLSDKMCTLSPWIYQEISFMNHIRRRPSIYTNLLTEYQQKTFAEVQMGHSASLKSFVRLYETDFPKTLPLNRDNWLEFVYRREHLPRQSTGFTFRSKLIN